jgi:site-specific DNA recombinase
MYIPRNPEELITEIVEEHKNRNQLVKNERNVILTQIRKCNHRLERARELMLDDELEPSEYRQIKEEATIKINQLESELSPIKPSNNRTTEISIIVTRAIKNLSEIDKIYDDGSLEIKKLVVSTLFPQKLDYNSGLGRTQKSNLFAEFIFLRNSELRAKKKGQNHSKMSLSHNGWLMGLEPTTLGTTNQYSNQLSYNHRIF